MSRKISRRRLIQGGFALAAGAVTLGVAERLAIRHGLIPPDSGGIYGFGETLTYASQRLLMAHGSVAHEFSQKQISAVSPVNGDPPEDEIYQRQFAKGFADWKLTVDGLVARPLSL